MFLAILNRQLNEVQCVDHFHLDDVTLSHCMDTATRYSAAYVVESAALNDAVIEFESCWLSQFLRLQAIHADYAFCNGDLAEMLKVCDIKLHEAQPSLHKKELTCRAVRVSNDLYGSDVINAYEFR